MLKSVRLSTECYDKHSAIFYIFVLLSKPPSLSDRSPSPFHNILKHNLCILLFSVQQL